MRVPPVVLELKRAAERAYGDRLHAIVLFGSRARGEAAEGSDVDVLLVLRGQVDAFEELDRLGDVIYDLNERFHTLLSVVPMSLADYTSRTTPLLLNVRREGVMA